MQWCCAYIIVFCVPFVFGGELYQALTASLDKHCWYLGPNDILWIYVSLASLMAFSLTLPFTVYQIWQFVRPALRENEARAVFAYIPASFMLFCIGLAFGYFFVSPAILEVLLRLGEGLFDTQLTAQNYLTFLLAYHRAFRRFCSSLPVLVAFLTSIGILTP